MSRLAINGGTPVRTQGYPAWPVFDDRERQAVAQVLESGNWGGYPFPNCQAKIFADRFAGAHNARFAIPVANGTVTIEAALRAIGVGPGDEVIVPAFTFEATASPVLQVGAIPVFVDVLPESYCLDPAAVESAIGPRTRAVIPVHLAMNMADMDAVMQVAARHGLKVIEDCAHAHGAKWRGKGAGSIGEAGSFSMQTTKLMTAGEGGAIITNNQEVFELCQSYVNCGRASETDKFGHRILGFNYRITEFQAAILVAQLERLPEQNRLREARAAYLSRQLAEVDGLEVLPRDDRLTSQAIYRYVFKYRAEAFGGADRSRFLAALEAEGFACEGAFYEPVYRSALFEIDPEKFPQLEGRLPWARVRCPVAEKAAYVESIWIPHEALLGSENDIDALVEAIRKLQANTGELLTAHNPLIESKSMSRAGRANKAKQK